MSEITSDENPYYSPLTALPAPPELAHIPGARTWLQADAAGSAVLVADVAPGHGPPRHQHETAEIQYLPACRMAYHIGALHFLVTGPGVLSIPPRTLHAFTNLGAEPVRVVAFFPPASDS
jgi:quercetin dioxygenase-like cupin family protein